MPPQPPVRRILILAANPTDTGRLRLDAEVREIQEGLKLSAGRDRFQITSRWAVRTDDLRRALLEHEPHIVHFSGHGEGEDGLMLEDAQGRGKLVSTSALTRLFKQFSSIECVLLNACYSEVQANALATLGPYVVGMTRAIGDRAAIEFAKGFYDGLGYNRSYPAAFEFGLTAIDLEGIPETATPVLRQGTSQSSEPESALTPAVDDTRNLTLATLKSPHLTQLLINHTPRANPLGLPEGAMDTESEFYIERFEDSRALAALQRQGSTVTILGPRQMGKSLLLIRTITQARQQQKWVIFLDFQRLETAALTEDNLFYRRFCEWMTVSLRLPSQVDAYWDKYKSLGNPLRCTYYVQDYLLAEVNQSIFLAMDEVDKLIVAPFRDEFFSMLRSWHTERAVEPVWKRLDLAMVACISPYEMIQDSNTSPFNVGIFLTLKDFNEAEVEELNYRHNAVLSPVDLHTLMDWVGGHPYLTRKAFYEVANGHCTVATLFDAATVDQGPFGVHLHYHLFRMHDKAPLVRGMLQVIRSQTCSDEQVLRRLENEGLVRRVGPLVQPRCRLYAEYFKEYLRE